MEEEEQGFCFCTMSPGRSCGEETHRFLKMYDDADPLKRVEEKRQERSKPWQIGTVAQKLDDKPWKNQELQGAKRDGD